MKEAASIFLCADIKNQDGQNLARWMNDPHITEYLNEQNEISEEILDLIDRIPCGMLTYHFNQSGRFFMVRMVGGRSIGFIKLAPYTDKKSEIVYVIGEKSLWGRGFGKHTLDLALSKAFFEMRLEHVTARIMKNNLRSVRAATACGMRYVAKKNNILIYDITSTEYIAYKGRNRKLQN